MNLATKITFIRILLVPFFMIFMFKDNLFTRILALFIFLCASFTDIFDGIIARRNKIVTTFGSFLDPLADKLIISAALISFVGLRELSIPAWMIVFIISREFIVTGLRQLALSKGRVIPADAVGKVKTTLQSIASIFLLIILIVNSALKKFYNITPQDLLMERTSSIGYYLGLVLAKFPHWVMFIVMILTIYSGISYLYKHREILIET